MATWAGLSEKCGPGKLMWLEEGDQAEIGGQAEIGDRRGLGSKGASSRSVIEPLLAHNMHGAEQR